jgi:hypothetical protein
MEEAGVFPRKHERRNKHFSRKDEPVPEGTLVQKEEMVEEPQVKLAVPDNLTPEEKAIYGRVISESEDWRTVSEEESVDYSLSRDPFEVPEPARKLEKNKEFKFRWVTRSSARLDEIKNKVAPFKWWVVNLNQPVGGVFKPWIDPNNGCVSREDQMLMFKPWAMFERERAYKDRLAETHDRSSRIESKDGEVRRAGRESEVNLMAGKRSGMEDKTLRQEIRGSDIQFRGEEEADAEAGRSYPGADSESSIDE